MRLDGKVGIVSGANQGIGRATALRWAEEGATVVCADIKPECRTHEEIEEKGGTAITVVMDVREADDWTRLVDTTVEQFGTVDLLANVAGVVNRSRARSNKRPTLTSSESPICRSMTAGIVCIAAPPGGRGGLPSCPPTV